MIALARAAERLGVRSGWMARAAFALGLAGLVVALAL